MVQNHYNVFLSYHPTDASWARGLLKLLEWLKLTVFTCEDIQVGESLVGERSAALVASTYFVQLVTPWAMVSVWEEVERNAFLIQALETPDKRKLLPVVLRPASLPVILSDVAACQLAGKSGEAYRSELARLVKRLVESDTRDYQLPDGAPVPDEPGVQSIDTLWPGLVALYALALRNRHTRAHFASQMHTQDANAVLARLAARGGQRGAELVATRYLLALGAPVPTPEKCLKDLTANQEDLAEADSKAFQRLRRELDLLVNPPTPVVSKPGTVKPADLAAEYIPAYLEAVRAQHEHLPLIGVNPELKLTLGIDDVYVPLRAHMHRGLYHEEKWHAKHPRGAEEAEPADIDLSQAFACAGRKRGLVILGDPGSGKTTLLKLLLVRCIRDGAESIGLPQDIVPVMLPLRDLKGDKNLDEFLQRSLSENPHLTLPLEFARVLRENRPLVYLLDGLDEVANEDERARVSHWIQQALTTHTSAYFAVTSRYAGYQGAARLDDHFVELNVRPLREPEAKSLVENFYRIVEKSQLGDTHTAKVSAEQKTAHLWSLLTSDQHRTRRMRELQNNPLLLTILCLVHQRFNTLPDERWRLYEWCLDTLLYHWQKAKDLKLPFERLEDARRLLLPFAWWLHQVDKRRHATADEVATALAEPLSQLAVTPERMRQFLKDVRDRSGLLVGWSADSYGFIHLAFQEHLTAKHLQIASHGKLEVLDEAARHFGESWWTEVILLLVSLPEPPMFEPFMRRVVMNDAFAHPEHRALLADCVADASVKSPLPFLEVVTDPDRSDDAKLASLWALRGMREEQKARVIEVCRPLANSPNPQLRAQARELLEARGERVSLQLEAGTVWVHQATGLEFVYVPPGSFQMGSDRHPAERPIHTVTFARGFWIGKYPVTNAQYGRFLQETTHENPGYWEARAFNGPQQPVVGVTWQEVMAYCRWASGRLQTEGELLLKGVGAIDLPSEAEWEYAARGQDGKEYPWGNNRPTPELANYRWSNLNRTTPVGRFPKGASWVGAMDMVGNVLELCADFWHENYNGAPRDGSPWIENPNLPHQEGKREINPLEFRVHRGGGWLNGDAKVRPAFRSYRLSTNRSLDWGFRVRATARPGDNT